MLQPLILISIRSITFQTQKKNSNVYQGCVRGLHNGTIYSKFQNNNFGNAKLQEKKRKKGRNLPSFMSNEIGKYKCKWSVLKT